MKLAYGMKKKKKERRRRRRGRSDVV